MGPEARRKRRESVGNKEDKKVGEGREDIKREGEEERVRQEI